MTYEKCEDVYRKGSLIGGVALFSDGLWRCSSNPDAKSFATRAKAVKYLELVAGV